MEREKILDLISENISNPDNYLNLAESYIDTDPDLAYLTLENAMFIEKDKERKSQIHEMMIELRNEGLVSVSPASIVILSYHNLDYTKRCIESIRMTCCPDAYEIVIVDNGSEEDVVSWLREQNDIKLILNKENMGFPKGCNQGIEASLEGNDIFLLNNDTVMLPNALYCLRMALYSSKKIGAVGPMGSNVGNGQQEPGMDSFEKCLNYSMKNNIPAPSYYEKKIWLLGFALLIRHDVREKVGMLDERFTPGNYEDNDYCYRILEEGYQNILCHKCLIIHYGGKGFEIEHNKARYDELNKCNLEKIRDKWGFNIDRYSYKSDKIINFIEHEHPDRNDRFSVLEYGCGMGATLNRIQYLYPNVNIYGIEAYERIAALGKVSCNIVQGDFEEFEVERFVNGKIDYILFGDELEQLVDIDGMIKKCLPLLAYGGKIVTSKLNVIRFRDS